MPLKKNKRSVLTKALAGGAQGASQALLLQALLGEDAGAPPIDMTNDEGTAGEFRLDFPDEELETTGPGFQLGPLLSSDGPDPNELMLLLSQVASSGKPLSPELLRILQQAR